MTQPAEKVFDLVERLAEKNDDVPIIVEGRNDVEGLRSLGFKGEIHSLNHGKSIFHRVEEIILAKKEVIILPDFDRKGIALKDALRRYVEGMGKTADTYYWSRIRSLNLVNCIEELPRAIERWVVSERMGKTINRYYILPGIGIKR